MTQVCDQSRDRHSSGSRPGGDSRRTSGPGSGASSLAGAVAALPAVRRGELRKKDAERQFSYVHGLRIRLLEDLVLHNLGISNVVSIVAG